MGKTYMVRRTAYTLFCATVAGLVVLFGSAFPASAASSSTNSSGIRVSPVVTNVTVNAGQTQTVPVYAENLTNSAMTLQVLINDFTAAGDESGAPALLLNGQYAPIHSLKRYVAPIENITLKPGEQKSVNAIISIPQGTSGGGYFGAVRFLPITAGGKSSVTLTASIGSLILVKVPGAYKDQLLLTSLDVSHGANSDAGTVFTSGKGLIAAVRFQNVGDVQDQPFGKLLLKKGNATLASYEINNTDPRGNVLPSSIRKFTVNLDKVGNFGKYTVVGNFGYGTSGQLLTGTTTFYVIPYVLIGIVAIVLLLLIFSIIFVPKLIRGHDQKVLKKATKR